MFNPVRGVLFSFFVFKIMHLHYKWNIRKVIYSWVFLNPEMSKNKTHMKISYFTVCFHSLFSGYWFCRSYLSYQQVSQYSWWRENCEFIFQNLFSVTNILWTSMFSIIFFFRIDITSFLDLNRIMNHDFPSYSYNEISSYKTYKLSKAKKNNVCFQSPYLLGKKCAYLKHFFSQKIIFQFFFKCKVKVWQNLIIMDF